MFFDSFSYLCPGNDTSSSKTPVNAVSTTRCALTRGRLR
jgi:hypothetical protein